VWELLGAGSFSRAYHSSDRYRERMELNQQTAASDLGLAEGLLLALFLVTPFWGAVALVIHYFA
jgi:hypothetical protein